MSTMEFSPQLFGSSLGSAALAVFVFFLVLFIIAVVRRNNAVADIGWGIGFIVAAMAVLWQRDALTLRQVVVSALVAMWSVRLAVHLWLRSRGKSEDWRYAQWRRQWGEHWVIYSFLQVFVLQAVLLLVVALPVLFVITFGGPVIGWLDVIGVAVWVAGFVFEVVADHQLRRFGQNPANKGRVLQTGLWRYSRHPNYFGEALMWWGIWLIALSVPGAWFTFVGPLLITFLLLRVSGVTLLEKKYSSNPEYLAYQRRTSAFVPLPPKK